jgi:hypothetical protein
LQLTTCQIRQTWGDPGINHMSLCPFVATEKDDCAWERAKKGRCNSTVQTSSNSFLPKYRHVGGRHRCVFRRDMGISLLSRFDCIEGMHKHIPTASTNTTSYHALKICEKVSPITNIFSNNTVISQRETKESHNLRPRRKKEIGRKNKHVNKAIDGFLPHPDQDPSSSCCPQQ